MLLFALNINMVLLKSICLCNGRMLRAFCFSFVDIFFFIWNQQLSCAAVK